jgi:TonB family protein
MLQYTLEVTLCWTLLYSIFFAFLRKETFFTLNRWYLISALLLGILIPLLRYVDWDFGQKTVAQTLPLVFMVKEAPLQVSVAVEQVTQDWSTIWSMMLGFIYLLGVSAFAYRLARSLFKIRSLYQEGTTTKKDGYIIVHTDKEHLPFSFLRCIFISNSTDLSDDYAHVLEHELSHVKNRHSLDVLFIELINIAFWFHPLVYVYKTALRQTHEYLADHAVLKNTSKKIYGTLLLKQSLSGLEIALAHSFFHSHIKKRINMMYQKKSGPSAWLKYALALPVLLFLTVVFARHKSYVIDFSTYDTNQFSNEINFFCNSGKGSVFPVVFLENTIQNQYKSGLKNTHFIIPEFLKQINQNYDPNKHFTIYIDKRRISSKKELPIDFSKPWIAKYLEISTPEHAEIAYGAPLGVVRIIEPTNDISLIEKYQEEIDREDLGSKYMFQNEIFKAANQSSFDKEEFIKGLKEINQQKSGLQKLESDLTDYIKGYLVRYPIQKTEILTLGSTPLEERFVLISYKGISTQDPEVNTAGYKLDQFKVVIVAVFADATMSNQFEELNGATPVPDLESLQLMYENSPQRTLNEKAKAIWVYNRYAHEFGSNAFKLKALDQQMTQFLESKGIDLGIGIGLDKLHPKSYESAPPDLRNYADLTRMDDVPIIWNEAFSKSEEIGISMDLDKPFQSMIHLSPSDAMKVFGADGEKGFYSIMGYQLPFNNIQKQNQLLQKDAANFFQTIGQISENKWLEKLKEVHKQLQAKYPKVGDWITPFTTQAHQHNITLLIKDKEIVAAYRGDGNSTERIDKDKKIVNSPDSVKVDEIFKVVQVMPRFPGCENEAMSDVDKKACADQKLLEYLYSNLKYPDLARKNGIEGRVYIQFVIEKDGSISESRIVRDIGSGAGQSALDVVNEMNQLPQKWTPGKQRGEAVRVLYTLPVTFKLEGDENTLTEKLSNTQKGETKRIQEGEYTKVQTEYSNYSSISFYKTPKNNSNLISTPPPPPSPDLEIIKNSKINHILYINRELKPWSDIQKVDPSKIKTVTYYPKELADQQFGGTHSTTVIEIFTTNSNFNGFLIKGQPNSNFSSEISLGVFNIPRGSVAVRAGNQILREGIDYDLDYSIGRIKILNDAYLQQGVPIKVSFEDKNLFGLQDTTASSNDPLYVINGVIKNHSSMEKINPDDIESIQVLKDEAAIKKYGEKGKNGVIEITLKKGVKLQNKSKNLKDTLVIYDPETFTESVFILEPYEVEPIFNDFDPKNSNLEKRRSQGAHNLNNRISNYLKSNYKKQNLCLNQKLHMKLIVTTEGQIRFPVIVDSALNECSQLALDFIEHINNNMEQPFIPATKNGAKVNSQIILPIKFEIN